VPDHLSLTFGSKFEANDYTGFEVEPGIRVLFTPTPKQTFWAAISRAVRTPSRADEAVTLNQSQQVAPGIFIPVSTMGNPAIVSEEMIAYEIGYRAQPFEKFSYDISLFYNDYNNIRSADLATAAAPPLRLKLENNLYGDSFGGEVTATWRAFDWWKIIPAYTLQKINMHARMDNLGYSDEASVKNIQGASPQNQFSLRSAMDFPHGVTFDTMLRWIDNVPAYQVQNYLELDARLAWQITKNVEVSIVGQNLLHDRHAEFGPSYARTSNGQMNEIPRSIYGKITVKF